MKFLFGTGALVFLGVIGWRLGGSLSSDAVGMALGVLFGVMAGIPASLMVLAARRRDPYDDYEPPRRPRNHDPAYLPQQPPVIVVAGQNPGNQGHPGTGADGLGSYLATHPDQRQINGPTETARTFRIIGDDEEEYPSWGN